MAIILLALWRGFRLVIICGRALSTVVIIDRTDGQRVQDFLYFSVRRTVDTYYGSRSAASDSASKNMFTRYRRMRRDKPIPPMAYVPFYN